MIEGHDLADAYFTNNEKTVVETIWYSQKENVQRTLIIKAEEGNQQWENLLTKISIDDLHENTVAKMREGRELFEQVLLQIATTDGIDIDDILADENKTIDFILDWIDTKFSTEQLFKLKLRIFEREKIKQSEDRKLKANLRKAKTLYEILEAYSKF